MKQSFALFLAITSVVKATDCDRHASSVHPSLLQRGSRRARTDPNAVWLAGHLKEEFMMDKNGKLRPQDGLSLPWDWAESGPRNAKNDCGDDPEGNAKAMDKMLKEAEAKAKLAGK